jgi:putative acetyltransferase
VVDAAMAALVVRPAEARDAGELASLAEATFRESWQTYNTREDMDAYCEANFKPGRVERDLATPGVQLLVADAGGPLLGYLRWLPGGAAGIAGERPAEISRLYARRETHGRGVGPALMRAFLHRAASAGHDVAWLAVWQRAPQPIAFCRKWGFEIAGATTFQLGRDVQDDHLMRRTLADFAAPVALRRFRPGDEVAVAALLRDTVRRINRRDYSPAQLAAWVPEDIDLARWRERLSSTETWLAEAGAHLAGFANLAAGGHLDCLYCHADWQGAGIASRLLGRIEDAARARGDRELTADVSLTARAFFERRGFEVLARQEVGIRGETLVNFRMRKSLA